MFIKQTSEFKFHVSFDCYEGKEPADVGLAEVAGASVEEEFVISLTAPRRSACSGKFRIRYCLSNWREFKTQLCTDVFSV
jgi:hypothetical protein